MIIHYASHAGVIQCQRHRKIGKTIDHLLFPINYREHQFKVKIGLNELLWHAIYQ
jgi:hypothetical protein